MIKGDGIGPEVIEAARICVEATGINIEWEEAFLGEVALKERGELIPEETLSSIQNNGVALKGPVTTPVGGGFRSVNVELRKRLNLYACLRPAKSLGSVNAVYEDVDIVVVRENTEDLYAGIEFSREDEFSKFLIRKIRDTGIDLPEDTVFSLKTISGSSSERIIRFAFEYALKNRRKMVTCGHKANILKVTDGLFLKTFYKIAGEYQNIQANDYIIDNLSMQLVLRPHNFEVIVLPNLYGDIISDLCAGLVGGLGILPGANIGENMAVFEPVHGSAPKYAGKNKVNPTATILSASLMLKYLGEEEAGLKIEEAVKEVIKEGKFLTYDLKPTRDDPEAAGTLKMAEAIAEKVRKK